MFCAFHQLSPRSEKAYLLHFCRSTLNIFPGQTDTAYDGNLSRICSVLSLSISRNPMWKQESKQPMSQDAEADGHESPSQSSRPEAGEDVGAFVGRGVEFKGTITYAGMVRIEGFLEGEIRTEGVLLVGEEAVITAKVTAGTIVCKGKITGEITAKEKIKLRPPAIISGGVKTPMLSIEEGVLLNGTLEMTQGVHEASQETTLHGVTVTRQPASRRASG
jgi:cytoskeletal protein CcmA (bactofilin family)